jgi:hypothetical protein
VRVFFTRHGDIALDVPMVLPPMDSAGEFHSQPGGRLWSLWDMWQANALLFYELSRGLYRIKKIVERDKNKQIMDHTLCQLLIDQSSVNLSVCRQLGATFSALSIKRFLEKLQNSKALAPLIFEDVLKSIEDIDSRVKDEFEEIILLSLNSEGKEWFAPKAPLFGAEFESKFNTDGVFELDEAAKSLAVGRSTAAVFHLMRIMEIGIRAVARCLQIPDPMRPIERNWGCILEQIKKGIERRWPTVADRMHGDGATLEALYASLDAVKNPFRNSTMHVDKKYTGDEAKNIFATVKGFMDRVASRMDEDGQPLA